MGMFRYRPSENSEKFCERLRIEFKAQGFGNLNISPSKLMFVSGGWKRLDVYRWEVWAELTRPDLSYTDKISMGGYDTLKDCVIKKNKLEISQDRGWHFEVHCIYPKDEG